MFNIAIDGHSSSGKGTLAIGLAKKFNLDHLDSGAILRAMGYYFLENGITDPTEAQINENLDSIKIDIKFEGDNQKTYLNGTDISSQIRQEKIGQMASKIAINVKAMTRVMDICRDFAKTHNCILDGRNITSAVLPDADVKIFLTATAECRAKRRFDELVQYGMSPNYDEILSSIQQRDYRDEHRDFAPLCLTEGTLLLDNTHLDAEQTLREACKIVRQKFEEYSKNNVK